jgi:hypothetical protein
MPFDQETILLGPVFPDIRSKKAPSTFPSNSFNRAFRILNSAGFPAVAFSRLGVNSSIQIVAAESCKPA